MNAIIYKFPKKIQRNDFLDLKNNQEYLNLNSKIEEYQKLKEINNLSLKEDKVFKGCYNTFGLISEQNYRNLLSFYNDQSIDNWENILNIRVLGKTTVSEVNSYFTNNNKVPKLHEFIERFELLRHIKELELKLKIDHYNELIKEFKNKFSEEEDNKYVVSV